MSAPLDVHGREMPQMPARIPPQDKPHITLATGGWLCAHKLHPFCWAVSTTPHAAYLAYLNNLLMLARK